MKAIGLVGMVPMALVLMAVMARASGMWTRRR